MEYADKSALTPVNVYSDETDRETLRGKGETLLCKPAMCWCVKITRHTGSPAQAMSAKWCLP